MRTPSALALRSPVARRAPRRSALLLPVSVCGLCVAPGAISFWFDEHPMCGVERVPDAIEADYAVTPTADRWHTHALEQPHEGHGLYRRSGGEAGTTATRPMHIRQRSAGRARWL